MFLILKDIKYGWSRINRRMWLFIWAKIEKGSKNRGKWAWSRAAGGGQRSGQAG